MTRWKCALVALLAVALTACDTSARISGAMDDGETLVGIATQTGFADQSGTLQVMGNRSTNCIGTYVYEGLAGPKGKAILNCAGGTTGEVALDMNAKSGVGTIGGRRVTFSWR